MGSVTVRWREVEMRREEIKIEEQKDRGKGEER